MNRLVILALLILAAASIAGAQTEPCNQCAAIYQEATRRPSHAEDESRMRSLRSTSRLYMRFYASVDVTNDTAKRIKQVTWESSLIDLGSMQTIATYTVVTRKKIAPHEVVTLTKKIEVPLDPRVMSADQSTRVTPGVPNAIRTKQVSKIREIEYTDGSVSTP